MRNLAIANTASGGVVHSYLLNLHRFHFFGRGPSIMGVEFVCISF